MLLKEHIYPAPEHLGNQKVTAKITVREHHVTGNEAVIESAKQTVFARAFSFVGPHRDIQHCPIGQRNHSYQARQRKTNARLLFSMLRKASLVFRGIRHRYVCSVHQLHRPALPQPTLRRVVTQQRTTVARQLTDHLLRQTCPRLAVSAGIHATRFHPAQEPAHNRLVHRLLAGTVRTHDLSQKHRQGHRRWELTFPVLRQVRLDGLQQVRTREQVEKMVGIDLLNMLGKATLLLRRSTVKVLTHEGWPRNELNACVVTNILSVPGQPSSLFSTSYTKNKISLRLN